MTRIGLGDKAKDRISGLTGIVVCVSDSLSGCRQLCIRPQETKDGKNVEGSWFDEHQLEVVESGVIAPNRPTGSLPPGGAPMHGHPMV